MTHQERERLFVDLFTRNRERIHRLCYGYLNSAADAEDLVQEVMTNVWNSLSKFRGESTPETWLYRIAVNTALMHRRRRHRSEPLEDVPDQRTGTHQNLEERERLDALRDAIAALPDQDRVIVTLLLEDLSYREIAEITGITVNHVGVKISRIKQTLEQLMSAASEVPHGTV